MNTLILGPVVVSRPFWNDGGRQAGCNMMVKENVGYFKFLSEEHFSRFRHGKRPACHVACTIAYAFASVAYQPRLSSLAPPYAVTQRLAMLPITVIHNQMLEWYGWELDHAVSAFMLGDITPPRRFLRPPTAADGGGGGSADVYGARSVGSGGMGLDGGMDAVVGGVRGVSRSESRPPLGVLSVIVGLPFRLVGKVRGGWVGTESIQRAEPVAQNISPFFCRGAADGWYQSRACVHQGLVLT